jgi:hypothetical protein
VSHAVATGNRKVTVALKFVSGCIVYLTTLRYVAVYWVTLLPHSAGTRYVSRPGDSLARLSVDK